MKVELRKRMKNGLRGVHEEELEEDKVVEDEDIYSEKARVLLLEDDEISAEEDGFMEGYEEAED